ncbi:MAG: dTDP-4-dehydrorhamnose reductase [Candidatus Omnitrophica bacterium]|nr:dTDP-4-dehydrorhamnose reductase [Candidatus Omnitrophota bacterium]
MSKKRVLITGSSGMLGVDLAFHLIKTYDIVCTDIVGKNNPYCDIKNFVKCDITDKTATVNMIKNAGPDAILHTAAWTDVDGCELEPEKAVKINAEGTHNVALGAKETNAPIFYVSSDFVFDGEKNTPYKEDDTPNPVNVYGTSKFRGESFIRKELDRYFIIRTSWLFGRYGRNFVDIILDKAERKEELRVVIDQFGSPTYTVDLCHALEKLMHMGLEQGSIGGVYHFSNRGSCSWYKYAAEIVRLANKSETKIVPITSAELDRPAKRPKMSILSTDKYTLASGDTPRKWESALEEYLFSGLRKQERNHVQNFKK